MEVKKKRGKKIAKRSMGVLLLLILLFFFLLIRSSSFQTYSAQQVGGYLSDKTNTKITVGSVDLRWFKKVSLRNLLVLDHRQDTLLYAAALDVDIDEYDLGDLSFEVKSLTLNQANIEFVKYKGEEDFNFKQFINKLAVKKKNLKEKAPVEVLLSKMHLKDSKFRFWDENKEVKSFGVDFHHLLCSDLNGEILDYHLLGDSMNMNIESLSLKDRSGFELQNLQGGAIVCSHELTIHDINLKAAETELIGRLSFIYEQYSDFKHFIDKVKFQSEFVNSHLSGKDLSYFVPKLEGLEEEIVFNGKITGKVKRLKLRKCEIQYGEETIFQGKLNIDGLPDFENSFIHVGVNKLITKASDIKNIPLYPFNSGKKVKVPAWLKNLGNISFSGKYTGFPSDFVAYGKFDTKCGKVSTDINFSKDDKGEFDLGGKMNTYGFNLRRLLRQEKLGMISFRGKLDANVKGKRFFMKMKGDVPRFDFNNYRYTGIKVDGTLTPNKFDGDLNIADTNLVMQFVGGIDFSKKHQEYKFKAHVEKAKLHQLALLDRDTSTTVSFDMDIDLTGNRIEDVFGKVNITDFTWHEGGNNYHFNTTKIKSIKTPEREMISVKSDWFTARIEGQYELRDLYPSLINIVSRDLPSLTDWKYSKTAFKGGNDFRLMFKIKDYQLLHDLFTPQMRLSNARFSGSFNDEKQLFHMNFKADTVTFGDQKVHRLKLYAHNKEDRFNAILNSSFVGVKDTIGLKHLKIETHSKNNLTNYDVEWNNSKIVDNHGKINGVIAIDRIDSIWTHVNTFDLVVEDNLWEIDTLNSLVFSPSGVFFDHFEVYSDQEMLNVSGLFSKKEENSLKVKAKHFQLANLERLMDRYNTKLTGALSGEFDLLGDIEHPIVKSDLNIEQFKLNDQQFGKVFLNSNFFTKEGRLALDLHIENRSKNFKRNTFELKGDYFPKDKGRLDLQGKLSNLQIKFLEQYFQGVFSDFRRGKTSGNVTIKGTLKKPEFYGKLKLNQMNLTVDYLNVQYAINGQYIHFNNDEMYFRDFILRHNKYAKSQAVVNGHVHHTGFKDFSYSMDSIRLKDMFCLNTTIDENTSYYGTAFVNGVLKVSGDGKNNYISGDISTSSYSDKLKNKGETHLNLPLGEVGELEVSDFIYFVDLKGKNYREKREEDKVDMSGLSLDINFFINKETEAKIIFDPKVGDEIQVNGTGSINMKITPEGKFQMSGKYTIEKGKYFFTLKNFIGKKFIVEQGGTISWDGDPVDAEVNILTHYQARAKLIDLVNSNVVNYETLVEQYSNRIPVYAGLSLKGDLMKPSIGMSVKLPNGTAPEQEFLRTHLVGEDETNRQVFALLLTSQFLPVDAENIAGAVNIGTGIDNGIQFLEGQLNNALGGVFNNLDLGLDYNSGASSDSLSNDELRLLLGFQYKNFSIKTDYALNNNAGEIQVEYKLTNQLKAKAYRRRTEQVIIDNGSNVTQGAGIVFQRSFNTVGDLFRRRKKKKGKPVE